MDPGKVTTADKAVGRLCGGCGQGHMDAGRAVTVDKAVTALTGRKVLLLLRF